MSTLQELAFAKESLLACEGFNPLFIGGDIKILLTRTLPASLKSALPEVEGNRKKILNYSNLSVLYHAGRRVPYLSAYNIDGAKKAAGIRRASSFKPDPRIDIDIQLSKKGFYDLRKDITEFEIGHMAANDEMAWGNDAQIKAYQTFHFPNSVPQAEKLNSGIWKSLESYIIDEAITLKRNKRICVFTGPVLQHDDPAYKKDPGFQIPLLFYKVVVFPTEQGLMSTGFMMSHEQKMIDQKMFLEQRRFEMLESGEGVGVPHFADFKYRKVFQVNIPLLEEFTGMNFSWRGVKRITVPDDMNQIMKIRKVKDAKDAADLSREMKRGVFLERRLSEAELTPNEIRTKNFKLNLILPPGPLKGERLYS